MALVLQCKPSKIIIIHVVEPFEDPNFGYWFQNDELSVKDKINSILTDVQEKVRKDLAQRVAF